MAASSLLIVVTFLAGNSWGPQVTTQRLPNTEICRTAMNAVAKSIAYAAKSNINGEVKIENNHHGELHVTAGVNQRLIANLSCN